MLNYFIELIGFNPTISNLSVPLRQHLFNSRQVLADDDLLVKLALHLCCQVSGVAHFAQVRR